MTRRPIEKRGRDVEKTVFLCPGQGSQKPGMGADLLDDPTVARVVGCASDVFGRDMAALLASDDPSDMADPRAAQAAIATLTIAVGRTLMNRGIEPCAVAGFSLGQMSALALSGMISDEDAFALVDVRSRIICDVAEKNPGGMSALLKAEEDDVRALCSRCAEGEVLVPANFNCPGQIVISGSPLRAREGGGGVAGARGQIRTARNRGRLPLPPDDAGTRAVFRLPGNRRLQRGALPRDMRHRRLAPRRVERARPPRRPSHRARAVRTKHQVHPEIPPALSVRRNGPRRRPHGIRQTH